MLKSATPILASLNAEKTIQFYTEKLGFKFINNWDGYVIFSRDEISIHLWPTNDPELPKATACYIYVSEVDSLYNEYKKLGIVHLDGKLEVKAWKLKQFSVLDNNGNLINFGEPV